MFRPYRMPSSILKGEIPYLFLKRKRSLHLDNEMRQKLNVQYGNKEQKNK